MCPLRPDTEVGPYMAAISHDTIGLQRRRLRRSRHRHRGARADHESLEQ
jgi:hypothetical protein